MRKEINKNIIILLIGIVIIILLILFIFFNNNTINMYSNKSKNNEQSHIIVDDNSNSSISDDIDIQESVSDVDSTNYIRETKVSLIDETSCTKKKLPLTASIEQNGNISISQNNKKVEIKVGNAKYLYRAGTIACDIFDLYYITEDMELYVLHSPNSTNANQKGTKVTENKVVEFLGISNKDDGLYLKVLLNDSKEEHIKYYTYSN